MKILVIDDKAIHQDSARATLQGHDVSVVSAFDEAMELLEVKVDQEKVEELLAQAGFSPPPSYKDQERWSAFCDARESAKRQSIIPLPFDVVLSDMMMPMSCKTLDPRHYKAEEQVPYGFVIALRAAARGAKYVAVVTDTNHHEGAMSAALDHLGLGNGSSDLNGWNCYWSDELRSNFTINGASCMFIHAPFVGENSNAKDWGRVLKALLQEKK